MARVLVSTIKKDPAVVETLYKSNNNWYGGVQNVTLFNTNNVPAGTYVVTFGMRYHRIIDNSSSKLKLVVNGSPIAINGSTDVELAYSPDTFTSETGLFHSRDTSIVLNFSSGPNTFSLTLTADNANAGTLGPFMIIRRISDNSTSITTEWD